MGHSGARATTMEERICMFEDVYHDVSARAQAEKDKSQAFGMLSRVKLWDRPKDADITLASSEKRYEPFWNVKAVRKTAFTKKTIYQVPAANPHAVSVDVLGQSHLFDSKRELKLAAVEHCQRNADLSEYFDGLQRQVPEKQLAEYAGKHAYKEIGDNSESQFVMPTVTAAFLLQQVKAQLMAPIEADEISEDVLEVESMTLFYRPVYAFEFAWRDKRGVLEIDGLTGKVNREGNMLGGVLHKLASREALFDVGIEIANVIVPGGGVVLRMVDKISAKKESH
jgi:hypothetical protein